MTPLPNKNYCIPNKSDLNIANSLSTVLSVPEQIRFLIFHVPKFMSISHYVGPKYILRYYVVCSVPKLVMFLERGVSVPSPNPKAAVPHFGRHLRLLILYTGLYPPYLEVFSSICNMRTLHAMVTGTHKSWTDEHKHGQLFRVWSCCCYETLMKLNNMLT